MARLRQGSLVEFASAINAPAQFRDPPFVDVKSDNRTTATKFDSPT
jgi:hypothetical protein